LLAEQSRQPVGKEQVATAKRVLEAATKALAVEGTTYTSLGPTYPSISSGRRTALARWIAHRENPLTARVAVNHIWARHFGRGLVETMFNFGRGGKPPSHPELLDWLAVELMEHHWSMKHLHRLIVTSRAYRMGSQIHSGAAQNLVRDRDNRYWWRFQPARMQAEVVRDSVLRAAGEIDERMGGPEIAQAQGLHSRRRSLYFAHHAETRMEFLDLFDGASPCECYVRTTSVLPQQALALTNSELTRKQAGLLADKLWTQFETLPAPACDGRFIQAAFEQVLSRAPSPQEQALSSVFLRRQEDLVRTGGAPVPDPAARAREDLVQALFSHSDFVTIR
jgi:hypothetical protein